MKQINGKKIREDKLHSKFTNGVCTMYTLNYDIKALSITQEN